MLTFIIPIPSMLLCLQQKTTSSKPSKRTEVLTMACEPSSLESTHKLKLHGPKHFLSSKKSFRFLHTSISLPSKVCTILFFQPWLVVVVIGSLRYKLPFYASWISIEWKRMWYNLMLLHSLFLHKAVILLVFFVIFPLQSWSWRITSVKMRRRRVVWALRGWRRRRKRSPQTLQVGKLAETWVTSWLFWVLPRLNPRKHLKNLIIYIKLQYLTLFPYELFFFALGGITGLKVNIELANMQCNMVN